MSFVGLLGLSISTMLISLDKNSLARRPNLIYTSDRRNKKDMRWIKIQIEVAGKHNTPTPNSAHLVH